MFKKALVFVALMAAGIVSAHAAIEVDEVVNDSITQYTIAVASYVAVGQNQVSTATLASSATTFQNLLENRKSISIQNLSTANVFVRVGLSSTSANGDTAISLPAGLSTTQGIKITPNQLLTLSLRARNNDGRVFIPFAVNDGATDTAKLEIVQTRSK